MKINDIQNWERDFSSKKGISQDEERAVKIATFYRYIDAGKLKAYKIGKEYRIERSEFERFMNNAKKK